MVDFDDGVRNKWKWDQLEKSVLVDLVKNFVKPNLTGHMFQ